MSQSALGHLKRWNVSYFPDIWYHTFIYMIIFLIQSKHWLFIRHRSISCLFCEQHHESMYDKQLFFSSCWSTAFIKKKKSIISIWRQTHHQFRIQAVIQTLKTFKGIVVLWMNNNDWHRPTNHILPKSTSRESPWLTDIDLKLGKTPPFLWIHSSLGLLGSNPNPGVTDELPVV